MDPAAVLGKLFCNWVFLVLQTLLFSTVCLGITKGLKNNIFCIYNETTFDRKHYGTYLLLVEAMTLSVFFLFFILASIPQGRGHHIYHVVIDKKLPCKAQFCLTLNEYSENAERWFTSDTTLHFLPGNHTLDIGRFVEVRNVHNLTLIGDDSYTTEFGDFSEAVSKVICHQLQSYSSGFAFINISTLLIDRLTFSNCGAYTEDLEADVNQQLHSVFKIGRGMRAALFFFSVELLEVANVTVQKSLGYGLLGLNALGVLVKESIFAENNIFMNEAPECMSCTSVEAYCIGGNAIIAFQDYASGNSNATTYAVDIQNSYFLNGIDRCELYDGYIHSGGGLGILFGQSCYGVTVDISNVHLEGNTGTKGGNMYVDYISNVGGSYIEVEGSSISYGNASIGGGLYLRHGLLPWKPYVSLCEHSDTTNFTQKNLFRLSNSSVVHNRAKTGGGSYFRIIASVYPHIMIKINKSVFSENLAIHGLAMHISQIILSPFVNTFLNQVVFRNTRFLKNRFAFNKEDSLSQVLEATLLGTVWVLAVRHMNIINCTFDNNELSGLAALHSNIIFQGDSSFVSNSGFSGGGMGLSQSIMYILPHTHINLESNSALQRGGGIYIDSSSYQLLSYCFFQVFDHNLIHPLELDIAITFQNNFAVESGMSLYGSEIDQCLISADSQLTGWSSSDVANYLFNFTNSGNSDISSDPLHVCICTGSKNNYNCSVYAHEVKVYRGQLFQVSVVAVGQRNGTAPAVINAKLASLKDKKAHLGKTQETQKINRTCSWIEYSVFSNSNMENIYLSVEGTGNFYEYRTILSVTFLPCPPGFNYTPKSHGCNCNLFLTKHGIQNCDISSQTVQKEEHMWIGFEGLQVHPHCPPDYCKAGEMNITLDDPDVQCAFNHSGILCGSCEPGLSLALGSSQCLECSNSYLAFIALFAFFGILLIFILMLLNLTTAMGTINGLILYTNILVMNRGIFFPSATDTIGSRLMSIFIAWMNLDFGIEVCFANGMDAYIRTWLQFVFPAYIWALVGLIIIASRYSVTLSNHLATNAVPVLATLFLLSYTKILRTIIAALSFAFLDLPNETREAVWLHDGNMPYFKGKHIPLAVFGILVFLLTAIPYTFLLLFGQLLQAVSNRRFFRWVNKMMPFFDAHHAPYKDKHRYWSGLLLIARIVILVAISVNSGADPRKNLLVIGCSTVFILSLSLSVGGVYKKWYLTVLETSFLLNLCILVLFMLYFGQAVDKQRLALHASIDGVFATFIGIIALHFAWKIRLWQLIKPMVKKLARAWHPRVESQNEEQSGMEFRTTAYMQFREPLIVSHNSTEL